MNRSMPHALFIGAAVADRIIKIAHPVQLAASNIARSHLRSGGVAANSAASFARAGGHADLLSALGDDELGNWLKSDLHASGLHLQNLPSGQHNPTASYSAIHGPDGELVIGLAEMDIFDQINATALQLIDENIQKSRHIFIDANLDAATIAHIAACKNDGFLAAAAVSPAKSVRLKPAASQIDFLFCNRREAAALTGGKNDAAASSYVPALHACGFAAGIITDGADPLCLFSSGQHEMIAVPRLEVVDVVNGAGDALAGGTFFGLASGLIPDQAILGPGFAAVTAHMTKNSIPVERPR